MGVKNALVVRLLRISQNSPSVDIMRMEWKFMVATVSIVELSIKRVTILETVTLVFTK